MRHAHRLDQLEASDAGRARAVADDAHVLDAPAGEVSGIDEAGGGDDRGAVLIVMEHRDVHQLLQRLSMMKQSGALMSSRLMPPKDGPR